MSGIAIVTDSASDLPAEHLERHAITAVPLEVRLGDADPTELRGLSGQQFWERAQHSQAIAQTAAPAPGAFAEAFLAAKEKGATGIVCVTISSALSGTYQAAQAGANEVADNIPIEVIDSRQATMGEGLLALHAAELAANGANLDGVGAGVRAAIAATQTFGTLESLEALRRGGRIGSAQALIGSLLSIKPVIEVRDGVVEGESKQRTRARSLRYLVEKVAAAGPLAALAVVHAAAADIEEFSGLLSAIFPTEKTIFGYIGPVIGAHTGPGTIGVCLRRA